jgi:nitrite reductase/ring-hydroxylating ferredoxin subunit
MAESWEVGRFSDVPEGGAQSFTRGTGYNAYSVVVARRAGRLYAFVNDCPHAFTPLDWDSGRLLSLDGNYLQCGTHGAMFRFEDGLCVLGPCKGQSLRPVKLRLEGEAILVEPG